MAESSAAKDAQYDVFLVHSSEDNAKARQINEALKAEGLNTWAHYKEGSEFDIGKPVFDNIISVVEKSKTILILVTKNAMESAWVTFEMLLSFEKSHREQQMCARLVFEGVSEKEKKDFLTGDLQLIPSVNLDFNKDSWKNDLMDKIKESVPMGDLLKAGSVAVGLVYNYYVGYLRIILPQLTAASEQSQFKKEKMYKKCIILVPNSCRIPRLDGADGDFVITKEGSLNIEASHGDKRRTYNPAVYSITKKDSSEKYFFIGECPFILETMHKINERRFADIDLRFQVTRFSLTLHELVNHRHNPDCHNTVHMIRYDDSSSTPAAEIWRVLEEELNPSVTSQKSIMMTKAGKLEKAGDGKEKTYFATVSNIDCEEDKQTSLKIIEKLKEKSVSFTNGEGQHEIKVLDEAKYNVFVVSKEAVKDRKFRFQYDSALNRGVSDNEVQVISVTTKGTDITDLPQNYSWITLLKEDEPDFLDKLWNAMQVKRKMAECIPVGKVYEGLAYAYLLNYLGYAVTGTTADGKAFRQRFEAAMAQYNCECPCVARVFVIVPKSCTFPPPGSQFPGEEHLGEIEPVVMGFRKYFLQLYRLTLSTGQKVCYAREYATPAITLHEMANTIPFSGLTKEAMNDQARQFAGLVDDVITNEKFKHKVQNLEDKCVMVYFDDEAATKEGVTKVLEDKLQLFLKNKDYIEFKK